MEALEGVLMSPGLEFAKYKLRQYLEMANKLRGVRVLFRENFLVCTQITREQTSPKNSPTKGRLHIVPGLFHGTIFSLFANYSRTNLARKIFKNALSKLVYCTYLKRFICAKESHTSLGHI